MQNNPKKRSSQRRQAVWRLMQTFFIALTRLSWNTTQQQLLSIPTGIVPPYATRSFGNERS